MPFFVIVIFAASDHWSGSYISKTKYIANGLAEDYGEIMGKATHGR